MSIRAAQGMYDRISYDDSIEGKTSNITGMILFPISVDHDGYIESYIITEKESLLRFDSQSLSPDSSPLTLQVDTGPSLTRGGSLLLPPGHHTMKIQSGGDMYRATVGLIPLSDLVGASNDILMYDDGGWNHRCTDMNMSHNITGPINLYYPHLSIPRIENVPLIYMMLNITTPSKLTIMTMSDFFIDGLRINIQSLSTTNDTAIVQPIHGHRLGYCVYESLFVSPGLYTAVVEVADTPRLHIALKDDMAKLLTRCVRMSFSLDVEDAKDNGDDMLPINTRVRESCRSSNSVALDSVVMPDESLVLRESVVIPLPYTGGVGSTMKIHTASDGGPTRYMISVYGISKDTEYTRLLSLIEIRAENLGQECVVHTDYRNDGFDSIIDIDQIGGILNVEFKPVGLELSNMSCLVFNLIVSKIDHYQDVVPKSCPKSSDVLGLPRALKHGVWRSRIYGCAQESSIVEQLTFVAGKTGLLSIEVCYKSSLSIIAMKLYKINGVDNKDLPTGDMSPLYPIDINASPMIDIAHIRDGDVDFINSRHSPMNIRTRITSKLEQGSVYMIDLIHVPRFPKSERVYLLSYISYAITNDANVLINITPDMSIPISERYNMQVEYEFSDPVDPPLCDYFTLYSAHDVIPPNGCASTNNQTWQIYWDMDTIHQIRGTNELSMKKLREIDHLLILPSTEDIPFYTIDVTPKDVEKNITSLSGRKLMHPETSMRNATKIRGGRRNTDIRQHEVYDTVERRSVVRRGGLLCLWAVVAWLGGRPLARAVRVVMRRYRQRQVRRKQR
eukprot:GHVO01012615.1.p1 GENE.GHVO01012615.1~~GHVO01012615.1.p1  ORF type:complete len:816 (+),score=133.13 GHVO01012615.1:88-2448(+)